MTSFLFLTIIEMAPLHAYTRGTSYKQKKMKIPYPSCSVLPNLTPMLLQSLHAPPPWPPVHFWNMATISHCPQIFPGLHFSFIPHLYLLSSKAPFLGGSPITPFRISTSVIFIPETHFFPQSSYFKLTLTLYYLTCLLVCFFLSSMSAQVRTRTRCSSLCCIPSQEHNLCRS